MNSSNKLPSAEQAHAALNASKSAHALAKEIFQAELPEQFIRTIPPQTLYLILQSNSLHSSADLLEIATLEQCRLLLDFDLWEGDRFKEERFWQWLEVTDATDDLELLQKLFKVFDLKLVGFLISKYVDFFSTTEPTDMPPAPEYYTPDKGYTWIKLNAPDDSKNFLLGRLLALIFETSAEVFYQLSSVPSIATISVLEEESFIERTKRLNSEGIPEPEIAFMLHEPFYLKEALELMDKSIPQHDVQDIRSIQPLVYSGDFFAPLSTILKETTDRDQFESELTYILNNAIVRWGIPYHDGKRILFLRDQVLGAINIGLLWVASKSERSIEDIHQYVGLKNLYRLGLTKLNSVRRLALKLPEMEISKLESSDPLLAFKLSSLKAIFPSSGKKGSGQEEAPDFELVPITSIQQLEELCRELDLTE